MAAGPPPVVTLGGIYDLTVDETLIYDNVIIATLSSVAEKNFVFGDYRLVVSTCHDYACKDKYCKDHKYKCKCKDRYSLTIPDPSGRTGITRWVIEHGDGNFNEETWQIEGTATCPQGYRVTGGGFSASTSVNILVSKPLEDAKGNGVVWYAFGIGLGEAPKLEIHAVCVQMQ